MVKPTHEMKLPEWRVYTDTRLFQVEKYQGTQTKVWWGMATAVGSVVLLRFVQFMLDSGALASSPVSP